MDAFWSRVNKTDSCWLWTGGRKSTKGILTYGSITVNRKVWSTHKYSWTILRGEVPDGMMLDHTCFNKICVNPDHLRLVTRKQNGEHREGAASHSKSGVRGVYYNKREKKWHVQVRHNGKLHHGGYYKELDVAEQAAIALRKRLFTHNEED